MGLKWRKSESRTRWLCCLNEPVFQRASSALFSFAARISSQTRVDTSKPIAMEGSRRRSPPHKAMAGQGDLEYRQCCLPFGLQHIRVNYACRKLPPLGADKTKERKGLQLGRGRSPKSVRTSVAPWASWKKCCTQTIVLHPCSPFPLQAENRLIWGGQPPGNPSWTIRLRLILSCFSCHGD